MRIFGMLDADLNLQTEIHNLQSGDPLNLMRLIPSKGETAIG